MKIRHIAIFLILLVCLVGAVSAADDVAVDTLDVADDDAVAVDNVQEDVNEDVSTEPADTAADDTLKAQDNNDELKTGTNTVEVNNFNEFITAVDSAVADSENDTYIINLNDGTYSRTGPKTFKVGSYAPDIIINCNGQTLTTNNAITFKDKCKVTINDAIFNLPFSYEFKVADGTTVYLNNVSLLRSGVDGTSKIFFENCTINNNLRIDAGGYANIGSDCIIGNSFSLSGDGEIVTDNPAVIAYRKKQYISWRKYY